MIYLIDNNKNPYGHSVVYRQSLLQIKETKHLDIDVNINKKYRFDSTFLRTFYALRKQLLAIPKGNIVHLLFADYYYKIPFASKYLKRNKTIITLHNYPTVWWRKLLLINFCKSIYRIIIQALGEVTCTCTRPNALTATAGKQAASKHFQLAINGDKKCNMY